MKIKTKLNKVENFLMNDVVKKSGNNLPLTKREKTMIKWFIKFQVVSIVALSLWLAPVLTIKQEITTHKNLIKENIELKTKVIQAEEPQPQTERTANTFKLLDEFQATVYAYNSFESQTDGDPFTGAFGDITGMKNMVANNCYLPGTIVEIMGQKYKVFDRMNARYGCDVFDICMGTDHQAALDWGKKITNVKILRFNK